jgi:tRNA pseudouridine38-40 synthase
LAETKRIVLIMEYDGTRYHGFQFQANMNTIQGETEKALWKLTGGRARVTAASRTDAGVHAEGQVACFRTKSSLAPSKFKSGLNHYLPADIAVRAAYEVEDSFNARREAVSRQYNYRIFNSDTRSPIRQNGTHLVPRRLDIEAINRAGRTLVGRHDFASFMTGDGTSVGSTVRTVYRAEALAQGELVVFDMVANSFLPHQVRNTVGALIRVGLGAMSIAEFNDIAAARTPGRAGPTVPAHGLCLVQINYRRPFGEN